MGMGISEFAVKSGVPSHTLKRLHSRGKFIPVSITLGGHRRYEEFQLEEAAKYIRELKLLPSGRNVIGQETFNPFFAYLLGLVMADGNVLDSGQVQLELKDEQIIRDVADILEAEVHPRPDRPYFRITVPRPVANQLVEYGVCRRKSKGFEIPDMSLGSFGHFLRGLFDGDGSKSYRESRVTVRFHGHPKPMAVVQRTFMEEFGVYLPWVRDKRIESGMLETSRKLVVDSLRHVMYDDGGICLNRKIF